jgi:hypothetical protein
MKLTRPNGLLPAAARVVHAVWRALLFVTFASDFNKCSVHNFRDALTELAVTTLFTTMPLWIMPAVGPLIFKTDASFLQHLISTISSGELFVYCAALVGPLVYIITKRYGEIISEGQRFSLTIAFPRGISFVLVSAVICIFAGFAFGTMKNPALVPVSGVVLNSNGIFWTSIFIYLLSLYCVFSASVYRNALSDFLQDSSSGEESFSLAINVERSGT